MRMTRPEKLRRMSGLLGEVVFDAVEIGIVKAEAVGAGYEECAIGGEDDTAFASAVDEHFHVFKAFVVFTQTGAGYALHSEVHGAAFGERFGPDLLIEEFGGPEGGVFAGGGAK